MHGKKNRMLPWKIIWGGTRQEPKAGLPRVKGQPDLHSETQSNWASKENLYQVIVNVRNNMDKDTSAAKCKIMCTLERVQSLLPEDMYPWNVCIKMYKVLENYRRYKMRIRKYLEN